MTTAAEYAQLRKEAKQAGYTPQESALSWGQVFQSALSNTPSSAAQFVDDMVTPFLNPGETVSALTSLASGLIQLAVPGEHPDEATAKAVGQFFANRYGSMEKFKVALAEDPVGILGDISIVATGGGALLARAPALAGKVGKLAQKAGQAIDPINLAGKAAGATGQAVKAAGSSIPGMLSGVGAESVDQAFRAGRAGGAQMDAFTDNLRGVEDVDAVVGDAVQAMGDLKTSRNQAFQKGKEALQLEKLPVDMGSILGQYNDLMKGYIYEGISELSPKATSKVKQMRKAITDFNKSKGLHNAKGADMLKRKIDNLYPAGINAGDEGMVVAKTRDLVKKAILEQVPDYAKVMKPYEQAIKLEREMQKALSLGKHASADTTLRKLQSVMRNNVNANFGSRLKLVEQLEKADDYFLLPRLAGQAMNTWTPRGLQAVGATGVGASAVTGMSPGAAAMLPMMSPRLVGEGALAAGQAARMAEPVTNYLSKAQQALAPYSPQIHNAATAGRAIGQTTRQEPELTLEQMMLMRQ
jgi:hypothetical protein